MERCVSVGMVVAILGIGGPAVGGSGSVSFVRAPMWRECAPKCRIKIA